MKVKIELSTVQEITNRLGLDRSGETQQFVTAEVLRRITRYMPYRTGQMIRLTVAQTDISKPEIVTDTPPARKLYHGVSDKGNPLNYTITKNPLAGPYWDKRLAQAEGEAIADATERFIERRF